MRVHSLIAIPTLCLIMAAASCRNGKPAMRQAKEATQEMIGEYKAEIADSVLVMVDSLAQNYIDNIRNGSLAIETILTERERLIKPRYLLNPADIDGMVTRRQKTAALACLITERPLRIAYGLPVDDADKAMAKLLSDLNYPLDIDGMKERSVSDNIRKVYEMCRERNQVQYFWEVQTDALINTSYLIASNPEIYYSRLTDEQIERHDEVLDNMVEALERIAQVDREMHRVLDDFRNIGIGQPAKGQHMHEPTVESFIRFHIENGPEMTNRRNRLLK